MSHIRSEIYQLHDYVPGKSLESVKAEYNLDKIIKLASNENPLGFPFSGEDLKDVLSASVMYPDMAHHPLTDQLAARHEVSSKMVVLGNGSDDVMQMIALSGITKGSEVITSFHTFSLYRHMAHLMGANYIEIPMTDFYYDLDAIAAAVTDTTAVIFIANPNNPTGSMYSYSELRAWLTKIPSSVWVVIDEAYVDFTTQDDSVANMLADFENLIFLRTFSKLYGLAGLRIGYSVANEGISTLMQKTRLPFNVNTVALTAASKVLGNHDYIEKSLAMNIDGKQFIYDQCQAMGLDYVSSHANFVCINVGKSAQKVTQDMLKRGVILRALTSFGLDHWVRISVGTAEQNQMCFSALRDVLSK